MDWTANILGCFCCFSQLVHGNSGNMSTALQQLQARTPLTAVTTLTIAKLAISCAFFFYF